MYPSFVFIVALSFITEANAQNSGAVDPILQDLLIQIAAKRDLADQSLAQMPDRVSEEIDDIMVNFQISLAVKVQERFANHYKNVEESLDTVFLPAEVGNLELVWKQLKAGIYDSHALDRLVEDFINRAHLSLEPRREELSQYMETQIEAFLADTLERAQENIRAPYVDIPGRYFPSWRVPNLPAPPILALPDTSPDTESSQRGGVALTGAAFLLLRKVPARIANKIPERIKQKLQKKLLGKVAAKGASVGVSGPLAPAIGAILLGYEVWDASQAKVELEHELRKGYLDSYKTEFSSHTMLDGIIVDGEPSVRQRIRAVVKNFLDAWARHSRREVERMLEAAEVSSLSPNVGTYIQNQVRKGRNSQEIVEDLVAVQNAYPSKMIREASFRELLAILRSNKALDNTEFKHLVSQVGPRILRDYKQHRGEIFLAADLLGVSVFLEFFRLDENPDWLNIRMTFEKYGSDMSEPARRGLLLAIQEKVAQPGLSPGTLTNIHRNSVLFRELVLILSEDNEKLYRLFGDSSLLEIVGRTLQESPEAARSFVNQWKLQAWDKYRDQGRFDALLQVVEYRVFEKRQPASDLAREISDRDELTPIVLDVGICGIQLWDTYVGTSPGRLQREEANSAIRLYRKGFPCELLRTKDGFEDAKLYDSLPFGVGVVAFREIGPVLKLIYFGIVSVFVVAMLAISWRLVSLGRTRTGAVRGPRRTLGERARKSWERIRSALLVKRSEGE